MSKNKIKKKIPDLCPLSHIFRDASKNPSRPPAYSIAWESNHPCKIICAAT